MSLTTFTTILYIFLVAMWSLVIYGIVYWWRDRVVTTEVEEMDDEGDGGIKVPDEPDGLGPSDWERIDELLRDSDYERETV